MPKEKRSNLAIFTLAGSILLSSAIIANQANGAPAYATKKEFTAYQKCNDLFWSTLQKDASRLIADDWSPSWGSWEIVKRLQTWVPCQINTK
jgi:hypothetical protein